MFLASRQRFCSRGAYSAGRDLLITPKLIKDGLRGKVRQVATEGRAAGRRKFGRRGLPSWSSLLNLGVRRKFGGRVIYE